MLSRFTARALIGCRQLTNMPYTESSCWQTSVDCWRALLWCAGTGSGIVWRRSPAPRMAGVDDIRRRRRWRRCTYMGVGFSGLHPSHAPDVVLIKHLWLESTVDDCGDAQLFVVALFQLGLYTVDIWEPKRSKLKSKPQFLPPKSIKIDRSFYSADLSNTTCNNMQPVQ